MNKWFKVFFCAIAAGAIYLFLKPYFGFNDQFAAILIAVACAGIFFADKINWALLFHKERELLSLQAWKVKAIAALKANSPEFFGQDWGFEAEIIYSVPIGVLYCYIPGLDERKLAFGEVWADSINPIVSRLETFENHVHWCNCKSLREAGEFYLKHSDKVPLSIWKEAEPKKEVALA